MKTTVQGLLGSASDGELILLAGPDYPRMIDMIQVSGMAHIDPRGVDIEVLRARVDMSGESLVAISSMPEIEGALDRSAFDRRLIDIAYAADRVVYCGMGGGVLMWPNRTGARMYLSGGRLSVVQPVDLPEVRRLAVNGL
jgi:hypothetical protein